MTSVLILILQVVCLVCVVVALVFTGRALRSLGEANEIVEEAVKYLKGIRTDMEGRFKEIEDTISVLRKQAKKKGR